MTKVPVKIHIDRTPMSKLLKLKLRIRQIYNMYVNGWEYMDKDPQCLHCGKRKSWHRKEELFECNREFNMWCTFGKPPVWEECFK